MQRLLSEYARLVAMCEAEGLPVRRDQFDSGISFARYVGQQFHGTFNAWSDPTLTVKLKIPALGLAMNNLAITHEGNGDV